MLKKLLLFFTALCCTILAGAESITVDGIVYNITSPDGPYIVEVGDNQSFSGTTVTIPATVTSGNITYSVTGIGGYAFVGCSELTSINIPNSVESIGGYAFRYCSGLTSVTFAEGCKLENIGGYAFVGCSGLTSITIPASVTSIGVGVFENCSSLTNIIVESDNTTYDSRDNCNAIIKKASNTLIAGCNNTIIPNSVTSIGEYAFHGCSGLTSITIPNSVQHQRVCIHTM